MRLIAALVAVVLSALARQGGISPDLGGEEAIRAAYEARRSGVWVEATGQVASTLADDRHGSPHQRFVVRLASGHTVLVSHNLDLARRVPLKSGDWVDFAGQYEWNVQGGVVHWTHHDPKGQRAGGYVRHAGVSYR